MKKLLCALLVSMVVLAGCSGKVTYQKEDKTGKGSIPPPSSTAPPSAPTTRSAPATPEAQEGDNVPEEEDVEEEADDGSENTADEEVLGEPQDADEEPQDVDEEPQETEIVTFDLDDKVPVDDEADKQVWYMEESTESGEMIVILISENDETYKITTFPEGMELRWTDDEISDPVDENFMAPDNFLEGDLVVEVPKS